MMKYAMHQSGLLAPESQVQTAPQRQDNALLMLLAGGVALFLILKRSQEAGATPPSGETPGVPVVPSGGIAEVAVSGTKGAIMGSHAVEKIPGTMIAWNVAWNAGSTTATWPTRILALPAACGAGPQYFRWMENRSRAGVSRGLGSQT